MTSRPIPSPAMTAMRNDVDMMVAVAMVAIPCLAPHLHRMRLRALRSLAQRTSGDPAAVVARHAPASQRVRAHTFVPAFPGCLAVQGTPFPTGRKAVFYSEAHKGTP